jgi:histidinol dehydrogenase
MREQIRVRVWKANSLPPDWFKRQAPDEQVNVQVESNVKAIISHVVKNGDAALLALTEQFDGARLEAKNMEVTPSEIKNAYNKVSQKPIDALKFMKNKVSAFERLLLKQAGFKTSSEGITIQNVLRPIESVGCQPRKQEFLGSWLVRRPTQRAKLTR